MRDPGTAGIALRAPTGGAGSPARAGGAGTAGGRMEGGGRGRGEASGEGVARAVAVRAGLAGPGAGPTDSGSRPLG
jgi:hypothetical protein